MVQCVVYEDMNSEKDEDWYSVLYMRMGTVSKMRIVTVCGIHMRMGTVSKMRIGTVCGTYMRMGTVRKMTISTVCGILGYEY